MRTLVLILLFIALPLASGSLRPEPAGEFWKGSGAGLDFARKVINDRDCGSSQQYFKSCRSALLVGAEILKLPPNADLETLKGLTYAQDFPFERALAQIVLSETAGNREYLVGRMVNAQLKFFDPFAEVIPRRYSEYRMEDESHTYMGTGFETQAHGAGLFVYQVFDQSPASRAGLRVHDRIASVNGVSLNSLKLANAAIPSLSATPEKPIRLGIERDGRHFEIVLQAAPVVVPRNPRVMLEMGDKRILMLRLRSFHRGACDFVREKIAEAGALNGMILDLRHNRGGLVDESECLVRLFGDAELVVGREPLRLEFPAAFDFRAKLAANKPSKAGSAPFKNLKLAVLTDARSMSASEITAGALQDLGLAWIVGERTYGKGTTQNLHQIKGFPKLLIVKTVSRYLRPSGTAVHGLGIIPNFEAPFRFGMEKHERRAVRQENMVSVLKLPAGEAWTETREAQKSEVQKCSSDPVLREHSAGLVAAMLGHEDNQAATALAILNCP